MKIMLDCSPRKIAEYTERYAHGFWQLRTPLTRNRIAACPWALDNGCFSRFDRKTWDRMLVEAEESRPVFVALPDIVGDAIRSGQRRAVEDLNRAAVNRALDPIGMQLPRGVRGREAVEFAENELGARYNRLTPRLTTQADGQFIQDIQQLRNSMGNGAIDPAMAQRFENVLNNQVLTKFQGPNATLTGETLKGIESDLGNLWRQFRNSPDPDQRMLGDAVRETQDILRRTVERSNPQVADELRAINQGWANFKRVQNAAGRVAAEDGVFSPAQLQGAVRAGDRSKDKGAFSRGSALMQDL